MPLQLCIFHCYFVRVASEAKSTWWHSATAPWIDFAGGVDGNSHLTHYMYTPENSHGTRKWRFGRWVSFSIGCFLDSMLIFTGVIGCCVFFCFACLVGPLWKIPCKKMRLRTSCSHNKSSWCSAKDGFVYVHVLYSKRCRFWNELYYMQLQKASRLPKHRCTRMVQDICIQVTFVWCTRVAVCFWVVNANMLLFGLTQVNHRGCAKRWVGMLTPSKNPTLVSWASKSVLADQDGPIDHDLGTSS